MAPFGGVLPRDKTAPWLERLLGHWRAHGYGRFLVEHAGGFVGVVGLSRRSSRRVMDRLGMSFSPGETFEHRRVPVGDPRRTHVVYRLTRPASSGA
jgi:RimJ/RimL family protein N-acetyltransferase